MIESVQDTSGILSQTVGMVTNRTRFKIFQAVLAVHVLVVAGPFAIQSIYGIFRPPPKTIMTVRLMPPSDEVAAVAQLKRGGGSGSDVPAPPAVIQAPPSQPSVKPVTAFRPPPVKPAPRQVDAPKPPPVRVAQNKTQPKPPKKKPDPKPPVQQQTVAAKPDNRKFDPISPQDWQNMNQPQQTSTSNSQVVNNQSNTRTGTGGGSTGGSGPPSPTGEIGDGGTADKTRLDYSQYVAQFLKQNWDTPSRIQLGGREPEVKLKMYFAPSGQITSWKIVESSGIAIMDNSVEKLMRYVRKIPQPPPPGITELTLIMAIND